MPVRVAECEAGDCPVLGSRDGVWTERRGLVSGSFVVDGGVRYVRSWAMSAMKISLVVVRIAIL